MILPVYAVTYFTGDETGGRLGTYKDKDFFKEEMADGRSADPMKLWPGPSSPVEFEYGYQALDGYISDNEVHLDTKALQLPPYTWFFWSFY